MTVLHESDDLGQDGELEGRGAAAAARARHGLHLVHLELGLGRLREGAQAGLVGLLGLVIWRGK